MDDIVKAALAKWPNVPHCHGWLGLDARGQWYMRDDQTQAAGVFAARPGEEVDTSNMPVNVLEQASEVMHAEVVRDVRPGVPLRSHDIRPTVLVKRGQMVLLSVVQPQGFQISARVEAMQDGRFGEQIKLKNRDSGRELSGRVQGPNQLVGL